QMCCVRCGLCRRRQSPHLTQSMGKRNETPTTEVGRGVKARTSHNQWASRLRRREVLNSYEDTITSQASPFHHLVGYI
ncbi:MAG TPA: hypothetical protein VEL31_16725, partial [Ktedonobacteraceae bacterium]|nr:hypothetical protein [Ktedonobacteraceae bacterium]